MNAITANLFSLIKLLHGNKIYSKTVACESNNKKYDPFCAWAKLNCYSVIKFSGNYGTVRDLIGLHCNSSVNSEFSSTFTFTTNAELHVLSSQKPLLTKSKMHWDFSPVVLSYEFLAREQTAEKISKVYCTRKMHCTFRLIHK